MRDEAPLERRDEPRGVARDSDSETEPGKWELRERFWKWRHGHTDWADVAANPGPRIGRQVLWRRARNRIWSRLPGLNQQHPRHVDRLRGFLARWSLPSLIALMVLAMATFSVPLALLFDWSETVGNEHTWAGWWTTAFSGLVGFLPDDLQNADDLRRLVIAITGLGGVILPGLMLGAIVFKLFVKPQTFVLRNKATVCPNGDSPVHPKLKPGGRHITIRLYNATSLRLVGVEVRAAVHTANPDSKYAYGYHSLELVADGWPLTHHHIPYTARIPLRSTDVEGDCLKSIQNKRWNAESNDFIIVTIKAVAPELGTELTETHVYRHSDVDVLQPDDETGDIMYSPEVRPARWGGWNSFDG